VLIFRVIHLTCYLATEQVTSLFDAHVSCNGASSVSATYQSACNLILWLIS